MNRLLAGLENWSLAGWLFLVLLSIAWYLHARKMRIGFDEALKEAQKGGR
jgi:hypothetical protein